MWRKCRLGFVYFALVCLLLTGCSGQRESKVSRSAIMFDTNITITLYGGDEAVIGRCFDLCRRYEKVFSRTHPDSELYALNRAGSMAVSDELLDLLTTALDYCERSGGAFDITMGAVSDLYAFGTDHHRVPDPAELAEAMSHVGWEKVRVEGNTVTLTDPRAVLDLGAIAKGYIADRVAELLMANGQDSAIINLGGNILCVGAKPDGSPFKVGIQSPFKQRSETVAVVNAVGRSVVTSGIYERCFEEGGQFYHHILDSATGLPTDNGLAGVSIVSDKSVDGDALSTLCFVLGLEEGMALIESLDGVEALFITTDEKEHYSSGVKGLI